ncbi:MAG: hypothetical protein JRG73_03590 [Deltaproteobacteria bacterium]|nr:hypothetical protein [Deltaproteobacteria bacterium]
MVSNIPREINGWVAHDEVQTYDRKTLFAYIDGGAELYLAYRFRKAYVHTYTKAGKPDIIMNIYDMGTSADAYGVFTSEREGDDIGIGQESGYESGLLRFFKGRFFVSVMAHEETPQSEKAVFALARAIANAIQSTGDKPELLLSLPRKGLTETSIRYFYNHTILNHHYYIADENILLLDLHTEAVLAKYSAEKGELYLLLVRYPSAQRAKKAFTSFVHAYMPDAVQGSVQTENGKWTAAVLHDKILAVVFDAPTKGGAHSLLENVRKLPEAAP